MSDPSVRRAVQSSAADSPQKKRRRLPKRPRYAIQVDPRDLKFRPPTLWERLRREMNDGLPGYSVSLAAHCVLVLVCALIASQFQPRGIGWVITATWSDPNAADGGAEQAGGGENHAEMPPERTHTPVTLPSVRIATQAAEKPQPKPESESSRSEAPQVPVRPADVSRLLSNRQGRRRATSFAAAGGGDATERCLQAGLAWLVRQQTEGGYWQLHAGYDDAGYRNLRTDTGATSLALLALLGDGHTHREGDYQEAVRRGLEWLVQVQKPDGDLHDHIELGRRTAFYAHSMGTIALCEALALTGDEMFREPAERAVRFLIESQHPTKGGWKYQPLNDERSVGDLSVTGWALMALHTARVAGIDVEDEAFFRAARFLETVQAEEGSRYKYMPGPAEPVTAAMTAEGLLCRQFLGWPVEHPAIRSGIDLWMRDENVPAWSAGRRNVYAWYYAAQFLHNCGGAEWPAWYGVLQAELVRNQIKAGAMRGSWSPTQPPGANHEYGAQGGRLYVTAMCLLALETPFRHAAVSGGSE